MNTTAPHARNLQEEVGKTRPFDLPEQEAYLNLVRTNAVLHSDFDRLFKSFGISEAKYNALRIIAAAGTRGIRSETVGQHMVARDPDTTRLIDRLAKAGFVTRARLPEDRRCVVVSMTDDGKRLLRRVRPRVDALHAEQLGHLSKAELDTLNALLFKARHSP